MEGRDQPAPTEGVAVELEHCDGCGAMFRPTPLNAPGACTSCCARWGIYAERYES